VITVQTTRAIHIGVGAPLSGAAASLGAEMAQAVQMAIDEKNATGGVLGIPIVADVVDDQGRVTGGESAALTFCNGLDALGVIGHYNSDVSIAAAAIYHACGMPMIAPIASNPALTRRGYATVFRYTNRDDRTGRAVADRLYRELGKRRAVIVNTRTVYGQSMADSFTRAFVAMGGSVLLRRTVEEGQRDFAPLIASLPSELDLIFYGGSFEGAYILRSMRDAGLAQRFAAGDGCWDRRGFLEIAGDAATVGEGVLVLSASLAPGEMPGSAELAERYRRRYGSIGNYALNSYDTTQLLLTAIEQAGSTQGRVPERPAIIDAIRHAQFRGFAYRDPVIWDTRGDNLSAMTVLHDVKDGRFRPIAEIAIERAGH
jgi:branched-chain amino acid transport system substrate-binding protein